MMVETMDDILHPGNAALRDPSFPDAPGDWSKEEAAITAHEDGLELNERHWEAVRALQGYYARHEDGVNLRELHDALDEKFHTKGGMRFLYQLLPGGPVSQGCRLAGLEPPAGASDKGFGSVV